MFNFEKLDVWHKAIDFADQVYALTKSFPEHERFGLTNQMWRTAVSVSSNIAEGSSRSSKSDFARFIQMAAGSVFEVISHATIAQRQDFLSEAAFVKLYTAAEEQSKMLTGLKKSLNSQLSTLNA